MTDRDISLRGSGELMHLIKDKSLNIEDVITFCALIWCADNNGECDLQNRVWMSGRVPFLVINKLSSLGLLKKNDVNKIILNPHVAGIGDAKKRGELRRKFRKIK